MESFSIGRRKGLLIPNRYNNSAFAREGGSGIDGSIENSGWGDEAIQENSETPKEIVRMEEVIKVAALDNRNYIRVVIGASATQPC